MAILQRFYCNLIVLLIHSICKFTVCLPVYLYGEAASEDHRKTLPQVRAGEYEGLLEKVKNRSLPYKHTFSIRVSSESRPSSPVRHVRREPDHFFGQVCLMDLIILMDSVERKPGLAACEHQRRRPAYTSAQTD